MKYLMVNIAVLGILMVCMFCCTLHAQDFAGQSTAQPFRFNEASTQEPVKIRDNESLREQLNKLLREEVFDGNGSLITPQPMFSPVKACGECLKDPKSLEDRGYCSEFCGPFK